MPNSIGATVNAIPNLSKRECVCPHFASATTNFCLERGVSRGCPDTACQLGEAGLDRSTPVDRTTGVGQEELKLRDDGDIDGLQLTEALGERPQRVLMLEHQLMSHQVVRRLTLLEAARSSSAVSPAASFRRSV